MCDSTIKINALLVSYHRLVQSVEFEFEIQTFSALCNVHMVSERVSRIDFLVPSPINTRQLVENGRSDKGRERASCVAGVEKGVV